MSKERPIRFTQDEDVYNNQIPIDVPETVGKVFFLTERRPKFVWDSEKGEETSQISAFSLECISEKQETTFNVDVPAEFDLDALSLKPWDEIELLGVDYVEPWVILSEGDFNVNNAMLGYSMKSSGIKKVSDLSLNKQADKLNRDNELNKAEKTK